jgi:uncharacterized HAD superfamily protein
MKKPAAIYVDMDDVICQTCRGFLELLDREFGRQVAFAEVTHFDLRKSFAMGDEEIHRFLERAHEPDVLAGFQPVPAAIDTLSAWAQLGYTIDIRTGRPPATRGCTEAWLQRHGVPYHHLGFVDKYGRSWGGHNFEEALTLDQLAAERFSLAVEDSGSTAAFLAGNGVAPVVLLDRPWNQGVAGPGITRLAGWEELARQEPDLLAGC